MLHLQRYVTDIAQVGNVSVQDFWSQRLASYSMIQPLTKDLLVALALQAFVERVFSLCGLLTTLHNRMSHSLKMRAFHKLNVLNRHCCYCDLSMDMNIVILLVMRLMMKCYM